MSRTSRGQSQPGWIAQLRGRLEEGLFLLVPPPSFSSFPSPSLLPPPSGFSNLVLFLTSLLPSSPSLTPLSSFSSLSLFLVLPSSHRSLLSHPSPFSLLPGPLSSSTTLSTLLPLPLHLLLNLILFSFASTSELDCRAPHAPSPPRG